MYAAGTGVVASNSTALKWFREAAERNSPSANFGLGFMYLHGYGLPQDYRTALKYLTAAADMVETLPQPLSCFSPHPPAQCMYCFGCQNNEA